MASPPAEGTSAAARFGKPKPVLGPPAPPKSRQQKRRALLDKTVNAVHSGTFDEATGAAVLRKAGFPDSKNPFADTGSTGEVVHAVARAAGVSRSTNRRKNQEYATAHGGALPVEGGVVGVGPGATFGFGRQLVYQLGQGLTYAPGGVEQLITHPTRTSAGILKHVTHPNIADAAFLGYLGAVGGATAITRGIAAKGAPGLRSAVTRSSAEGGGLLHTPLPQDVRITVPGERLPGPATKSGRVPRGEGVTVRRGTSANALVRPFQVARGKQIQRAVNKEKVRAPGLKIGSRRVGAKADMKVTGVLSGRTTVGRELRADARTQLAIENAASAELHRAVHGLTRGEHTAVSAVAIGGDEVVTNPAVGIAKQIAVHQHLANLGGDAAGAHLQRIADLKAAQVALEKARPKFVKALALAKEVSQGTEEKLIAAGHLTPARAAGRMAKISDIYGHTAPPTGSFYFPLARHYENVGMIPAGTVQMRPSPFGSGPASASARVPGLNQGFTGESIAQARLPVQTAEALARRDVQVNNLLQVEKQYANLWRIATPTRRSLYDIPIRDSAMIRRELRDFFAKLSDRVEGSADELLALTVDEAKALRSILTNAEAGGTEVGIHIPGTKWVDSRYLSDMGPGVRSGWDKAFDAFNNPIRFFQLYSRPAYILNLAGNLGMNGISEGVRVFPALKWAVTAPKRTSPKALREADAGMGVSLSRIYSVGTGPAGKGMERIAEGWNALTDMHARRAALRAQAARMGYSSDAAFERLMLDPALEATKTRAFRVANKNIVDYASLTPFERDHIRRLIYFYPWVSRGTIWTLRTMVEHPLKSYTLFELGQIGAENAHKNLGHHLPNWVEDLGLMPGRRHGDLVKVINPSTVWTPTTAVQAGRTIVDTTQAALGLPHTGSGLGDAVTPLITLGVQAASRYEGGPNATGLKGVAEGFWPYQSGRRGGLYGEPSKTYPERGLGPALGPPAAGGFYPRGISVSALAQQAVNQQRTPRAKLAVQIDQAAELGLMTPEQAKAYKDQLPDVAALTITSARRRIGAALKDAYAAQAAGG